MKIKIDHLALRTALTALGVLMTGIACGILRFINLGVDPYMCFTLGINTLVPISYGTFLMLINAATLIVVFFLDKHYIGINTLLNMFFIGYIIEFIEGLLRSTGYVPSFAVRILLLAFALTIACLAAALYYTADLGVSTYDAIPLHISDCKPKVFGKVVPFRFVRITTDCICVLTGVVFGVMPGIGTILTAFCMGPLITFFRNTISDPILARAQAKDGK